MFLLISVLARSLKLASVKRAEPSMKTQCKAASFCLVLAAVVLAVQSEPIALLAASMALHLYALTTWRANWYEGDPVGSWTSLLTRRYQVTLGGVLCAMAGMLLLVGYFAWAF